MWKKHVFWIKLNTHFLEKYKVETKISIIRTRETCYDFAFMNEKFCRCS